MKFLVALSIVALIAGASAHKESFSKEKLAELHKVRDVCITETGAAADVFDKWLEGDFTKQDKPTKCFTRCFYQKEGFFDKDDNLDLKVALKKVGEDFGTENAEKWITPCKDITQKDPCDKAYEISQCFHKNKHTKQ